MCSSLLDVLLTGRATRLWVVGFAGIALAGALLHTVAFCALPTVTTSNTEEYCVILHALEAGRIPDLSVRHVGYSLFLLACKALPLPLYKGLPLMQHLLDLAASIVVMVWMRRQWGVLAGLCTGALLLVNASRAFWSHYAEPTAVLCSLVPLGVICLLCYLIPLPASRSLSRRRYAVAAAVLWTAVFLMREEVLAVGLIVPFVVWCFIPHARGVCYRWFGIITPVLLVAIGARLWANHHVTERVFYTEQADTLFADGLFLQKSLVSPPRPAELERIYAAAIGSDAAKGDWRDGMVRFEGLLKVAQVELGMTEIQARTTIGDCSIECILRRPVAFSRVVLSDALKLWLHPLRSNEWEAFRISDPDQFHRDAARLAPWAVHSAEEFPISYDASRAQRWFQRLAVIRPGENFAMRPIAILFALGCAALLVGIGATDAPRASAGRVRHTDSTAPRRRADRPTSDRRWAFVGIGVSVIALSLLYAAIASASVRYRMSVEWAMFAVAALGLVLPLRALSRREAEKVPG